MSESLRISTIIRGPGLFKPGGRRAHLGLTSGQPLLLEREPGNPADPCAVILRTLDWVPVGYVQRPKSVIVASLIDQGMMLLGRVSRAADLRVEAGRAVLVLAHALIWSDGHADTQASTTNENPCLKIFEDMNS